GCAAPGAAPRFAAVWAAELVLVAATPMARQFEPGSWRPPDASESDPAGTDVDPTRGKLQPPCPWLPSPLPGRLPKVPRGGNRGFPAHPHIGCFSDCGCNRSTSPSKVPA